MTWRPARVESPASRARPRPSRRRDARPTRRPPPRNPAWTCPSTSSSARSLPASHPVFGTWLMSGAPSTAEALGCAGFDFLVVDMEHMPVDTPQMIDMLRTIAGTPAPAVVRLPWNDMVMVKRALDAGAQSLLLPFVQNADEARRAVAYTRYPPDGVRGVAGIAPRQPLRHGPQLPAERGDGALRDRADRDAAGARAAARDRGGAGHRLDLHRPRATSPASMGHLGDIGHARRAGQAARRRAAVPGARQAVRHHRRHSRHGRASSSSTATLDRDRLRHELHGRRAGRSGSRKATRPGAPPRRRRRARIDGVVVRLRPRRARRASASARSGRRASRRCTGSTSTRRRSIASIPRPASNTAMPMPESIGCFALREPAASSSRCASGIWLARADGTLERKVADAPYDPAHHRFNDGRCDRQGRFFAGSMNEKRDAPSRRAGARRRAIGTLTPILSRHHDQQRPRVEPRRPHDVPRRHADAHVVHAYDYDVATGTPSQPRVFAQWHGETDRPDGGAVDSAGNYWTRVLPRRQGRAALAARATTLAEYRGARRCARRCARSAAPT